MNTSDRLIRKTFIGVWIISGMGVLLSIACVLIDAVFTGQFLGPDAVTAAGLVQPVTMIVNILGALMGPGLGVVCTRYMGMARKDMVNKVFSIGMIGMLALTGTGCLTLYFASGGIANALGARTNNPEIIEMVYEYLKGFSLAVMPMCFTIGLSGLMIIDNDKGRGVASMFATLLSDVLFDALNVTVFHGGMFGMAIATAMSQAVGFFVVCTHFIRKDRILKFSFKEPDAKHLKDIVLCGIPSCVSMGSSAIRVMIFNAFLLTIGSSMTVAGFSAANSLFSIVQAISLGFYLTSTTVSSFLYGEEDRNGIVKTLRTATVLSTLILLGISGILALGSNLAARGFLDSESPEALEYASTFIRVMAASSFLNISAFSQSGVYQGTRRNVINYIFVALREGILPIACALGLGLAFGVTGFEIGLIAAGALTFLSCYIIPAIVNRKFSLKTSDLVLLPEDFGARKEDLFEASMNTMEEVVAVSAEVTEFVKSRGRDMKVAYNTGLFIEEMAGNSIAHGNKRSKSVNVEIRVICHPDKMTIRIRDDGAMFDPLEWLEKNNPDNPSEGLGIRIIAGLAKDVRYIPSLGLNNLLIQL